MSLAQTKLRSLRAEYPSQLDKDELRRTRTGLLQSAIDQTESPMGIISPDVARKALESIGRGLDIPVMKKGNVTITEVRTCDITGGESDSELYTVVWSTMVSNIVMSRALYETNIIGYNTDLNKQLMDMSEAWKVQIETDLDLTLEANKTQVFNSTIPTTDYTVVGGAIQVPVADQEFFFNSIDAINVSDDFNSPINNVIASPSVMPVVNRYINQGDGNGTNSAFQFAGKDFTFSNRTTVAPTKRGTGFWMPEGTLGLLTRRDQTARLGLDSTDGTDWFEENIPDFPFPVGIKYKSTCSDQSAKEVGLDATLLEEWQFSIEYAIVVPYNSDPATKASAIRKFEFVA